MPNQKMVVDFVDPPVCVVEAPSRMNVHRIKEIIVLKGNDPPGEDTPLIIDVPCEIMTSSRCSSVHDHSHNHNHHFHIPSMSSIFSDVHPEDDSSKEEDIQNESEFYLLSNVLARGESMRPR